VAARFRDGLTLVCPKTTGIDDEHLREGRSMRDRSLRLVHDECDILMSTSYRGELQIEHHYAEDIWTADAQFFRT